MPRTVDGRPPRRAEIPVSRRPRVAIDLRAVVREPTGIGVHTLELAERLAGLGEFELVGLAHREPLAADRLRRAGIAVEWQPAPLGVVWQQWQLPRRLALGDLDLLWSPLLTLPRKLPVPGVVTIHDLAALLWPETLDWRVRWSLLPFLTGTVDRAARVIAVSHAAAADLAHAFPAVRAKLEVIWNGVGPEWAPLPPARIAELRVELGAPRGYYLYAGTLEPRKNVELLLDAYELLAREAPDAVLPLLVAGGSGWKHERLVARLAALEPAGVRRLGRLGSERLREVVAAATAFVYPSHYEGFGLPVAEAMASGVPVVVARVPSLVEVAGDAGLAVEADDAAALAHALERLVTEPGLAAELARRGLARVGRFSWDDAARRLADVFHAVLAERGARRP